MNQDNPKQSNLIAINARANLIVVSLLIILLIILVALQLGR